MSVVSEPGGPEPGGPDRGERGSGLSLTTRGVERDRLSDNERFSADSRVRCRRCCGGAGHGGLRYHLAKMVDQCCGDCSTKVRVTHPPVVRDLDAENFT